MVSGWRILGAGIASIAVLCLVILSIFYIISPGIYYSQSMPAVLLTLIVVSGVAGLIAVLAIVSVVLSALGLSDPKEALGLPKGSVRALIALSLILIFSIVSLYLYGRLDGQPSEEQTRFAQQIVTTVSTLVVAVAAFYFGARSVETAREAVGARPELSISPSGEIEMDITKEEGKTKPIKVETTPRDEKIIWKIAGDKLETLVQTKPNEFKYTASENLADETTVILSFTLAKHSDISDTLTITIRNKPAEA